jgi:hypothetical protein
LLESKGSYAEECGCIDFDLVDLSKATDVRFFAGNGSRIFVVYIKDSILYFSISFDGGKTFSSSVKLFTLEGTVGDIQFLEKDDQFVIALKETISNQDYKRAISGSLSTKEKSFSFKECNKTKINGKLLNISLSFRKHDSGRDQSIDHTFILQDNKINHCQEGH